MRRELDDPRYQGPEPYHGVSAETLHARLRKAMLLVFPWLDVPIAPRITRRERIVDYLRLLLFGSIVIGVLALPGILAAALIPDRIYLGLILSLAALTLALIVVLRKPLHETAVETNFSLKGFLWRSLPIVAIVVVPPLLVLVGTALVSVYLFDTATNLILGADGNSVPGRFSDWWWEPVTTTVLLGLLGLIFVIPGIVLWLRYLERRDSSQDAPHIDEAKLAEIERYEDWISQNHMGSIVHIRPGVLRTIVVKAGHLGLGLLLRFTATHGYLGSMRTVHFAHWAFLNNDSRLLFVSNYDQSWGAYLDDFVEKAAVGLTLAWGCGVGFPTTRFLIFDGASHGRKFKAWALASRTVSRFWYSAYPELSVDQIERNYRVATGLRERHLSPDAVKEWMRDL